MISIDEYINNEIKNDNFAKRDIIAFHKFELVPINTDNFKDFCKIRFKLNNISTLDDIDNDILEGLNMYKDKDVMSYVIEANNKVIGILMYKIAYHDLIYLGEFIIDDNEYKNKGIGTKIIEYLKSLYSIEVFCSEEVINFYKKNGFKLIRKLSKYEDYPYLLEYLKNC